MHYLASRAERDLLKRVMKLSMRRKLQLAYTVLRDHRITPVMEAPLLAAVTYIFLPFNLIPRRLSLIRAFDDLVVAGLGLWMFVKLAPQEVLEEHLAKIEKHQDDD